MKYLIPFCVCLVLFACSKEDSESPSIDWSSSSAIERAGDSLLLTAPFAQEFTLLLTDDQELDQVLVRFSTDTVTSGIADLLQISDLEGDTDVHTFWLQLNNEVQGRWEFALEVADKAGNHTDSVFTVVVSNSEIPDVSENYWSAVRSNTNLNLAGDDSLSVGLLAEDSDGLASLALSWTRSGAEYAVNPITLDGSAYADTAHVAVPEGLLGGDVLEVIATDALGNTCRHRFTLTP